MDHAVSLVQAYLQLNGYFTAAEYPVMESMAMGGFRTLTDIDILAFRFPRAGQLVTSDALRGVDVEINHYDPGLAVPQDRIDMLIGEVKEGRVQINSGARDPAVLRSTVVRFGCPDFDADEVVRGLLETGVVRMSSGHQIRFVAFGTMPPGSEVPPCRIISLGHVLRFLQDYVRSHWHMLRHTQFKDPAFGFLMTMEKARRGAAGRRGKHGVEIVEARAAAPDPSDRRGRIQHPDEALMAGREGGGGHPSPRQRPRRPSRSRGR